MKTLMLAFAPFALVTALVVGVRAASEDVEHVTRTLQAEAGGALRLKSFSGRVNVIGTDSNEVTVDAVRRGPRNLLDHVKLDIYKSGNAVYINANRRDSTWSWWHSWSNDVVNTDLDVHVPRRTDVEVSVFSAPVTIESVDGTHRVTGFSSRIRLDDVAGPVRAHTFSGSIDVQAKEWRDGQDVDIDTFSGNVTMRVPDGVRGTVSFNSFSGHFKSDLPLTLRSSNRKSMRAELGSEPGDSTLRFKTFSGNVNIGR
ncbi:MAG TPA: DUF4097 family beta strand repeat-containing protein [Vicinamibacterales bacterium]|jgi:hypothetical protein